MVIELEDRTAFITDAEIESNAAQVNIPDADEVDMYQLRTTVDELRDCIRLLKQSERKKNIRNATFKFAICSVIIMDIIAYAQADKTGKSADNRRDDFYAAVIIDGGNQTTCGAQTPTLSCSDVMTFALICEQLLSDFCSMRNVHLEWTAATAFIFMALFVFCCAPLFNDTCRKNLFRGFNQSPFRNIYSECSEDDYEFITSVTVRNEIQTDRQSKSEVLRDLNKKLNSITDYIRFSNDPRSSIYSFFTRSIPLRALTRRNDNRVYSYVTIGEDDGPDGPEEVPQLQLPEPGLQLEEEKVQEEEYKTPQEEYDFEEEQGLEMATLSLFNFTSRIR
jgi:hypothetical protein